MRNSLVAGIGLVVLLGCGNGTQSASKSGAGGTSSDAAKGGASSAAGGASDKTGANGGASTTAIGGASSANASSSQTGGVSSGGDSGRAGAANAGSPASIDCGLPTLNTGGKAKPAGSAGNLKVLDWAGFKGAYTYTFDDGAQGLRTHYADINAAGVHVTFFLIGSSAAAGKSTWDQAVTDGHELGNHSQYHIQNDVEGSDIAAGKKTIESLFGVKVYTMAAPYGDDYSAVAKAEHFLNRGVNDGIMKAGNDSSAFTTPCLDPNGTDLLEHAKSAETEGGWKCILIHGFTDVSDGSWHPQDVDDVKSAMSGIQALGTVWVDSYVNIGAYWRGQVAFQKATPQTSDNAQNWTWTLPDNFPPNKCLRVTVDGGTLTQNGKTLPWDVHGYYEISLDAKSLTLQ
jgi:peptidoglycan/xylan/chitin deacetylase (PgdA/CDA1 family)